MNTIQLQDQNKLTKIFVFLLLSFALAATAQQIIRIVGASGIEWYSCESECVIVGIGNGNYFVAGTDVDRIEDPTENNSGTGNGTGNGNSNGSSSGSIGGGGGEGTGSGGVYTFRPMGSGSASAGSACPGGTSMHCNSERCVILCHQE